MGKFIACLVVVAVSVVIAEAVNPDCPPSSKVSTCTPTCVNDSECSTLGGRCCPNICNARSCAMPNQKSDTGSGSGYKGSSNTATGNYCGNAKCNSYEKCDTKRMRCVRN